jgi:hypothetical protein
VITIPGSSSSFRATCLPDCCCVLVKFRTLAHNVNVFFLSALSHEISPSPSLSSNKVLVALVLEEQVITFPRGYPVARLSHVKGCPVACFRRAVNKPRTAANSFTADFACFDVCTLPSSPLYPYRITTSVRLFVLTRRIVNIPPTAGLVPSPSPHTSHRHTDTLFIRELLC